MNINIKIGGLFWLVLLMLPFTMLGQDTLLVRGKIVAGKNKPVQDVSVSVAGMDQAPVITGEDGEFSVQVLTGNEWLIIKPIGDYKEKQVALNNRQELVISLSSKDIKSGYDDVEMVNQTKMKRRDIVASIRDMDVNDLQYGNIVSINQAFQGQVAGMFTTTHSGMPGQGAVSYIRGISSPFISNDPLYMVDGIPIEHSGLFESNLEGNVYNPLSTIDPADISSVTIVKDPSLTALYGTKAANGLVLIKTLEPKATETTISVSLRNGVNVSPQGFIPQLADEHYKTLANEILITSPVNEEWFEEYYPGLYIDQGDDQYYRYTHNTNWQKLVFSNALMNDAYLSMKGGSDIAKYGLSVGYHNQGGVFENTSYNRFNVRLVSDLNVFSWLQMKVNANLTNTNSYLRESAISYQTSPLMTSLSKPPILGPYQYDDQGQQLSILDDVDELGTSNPMAVNKNFKGENKNYRFISSILATIDISKPLKLNTLIGLNFNTMKESVFRPNRGMENYFNGEAINVAQGMNNQLFSFYSDNYLNYSKQFSSVHSLHVSSGFRIHTNRLEVDFGEAMNMPENDQYTTLQSGENDLRMVSGNNARWNWLSIYNQISYKFKDTYLVNTGLSADFSTLTGLKAQTAFNIFDMPFDLFYSIGAGWRLSNEAILEDIDGLENFLLRASYGSTGNGSIGLYNALDYYRLTRYRETSGLVPGTINNQYLKHERIDQINTGVDLSLWGGRTRLSLDYFIQTTRDMLIYEPQVGYVGFNYRPSNAGMVRNTGWELTFFQRMIDGKQFDWDISPSISLLSNRVMDVKGDKLVTSFEGGDFVTQRGDPVNSFYGYLFEGVYATQEEALEAGLVNAKGMAYGSGDAIFSDVSGPDNQPDGVINSYDKVNLGSPLPDFFGSISTRLQYARWILDMRLQFVYGNEVFNYARYMNERMVDLSNQSQHVLQRWQYEGDQTNVPRALWNDPVGNSDFSSRWIEDGSYIRLKNITLGYSIPGEFLVFKNADLYITATNLFTIDNYLGYDPEFSYSYNPMQQGIDYGLMPQFRQFLFGIRVGL